MITQVAQSLNMVWLISAGSFEDPFCLMEVCAAVRQGTPVLPVRLAGAGMRPLNLPIWAYSIEVKPSRSGAPTSSNLTASSADDTTVVADANTKNGPGNLENSSNRKGGGGSSGGEHQMAATGGNEGNTAIEFRERGRRLRRRAVDGFYAQLAQRLPKQVQAELHRNRFLVKDVIAAVRSCFEGTGESETGDKGQAGAGAAGTRTKAGAKPPVFDISDQPAEHDMLLTALVGVSRRKTGKADVEDVVNREKGTESAPSSWNWEQVPRSAPLAGRARLTDAVPWRTDEEVSEMIKMEEAEADDLAGENRSVTYLPQKRRWKTGPKQPSGTIEHSNEREIERRDSVFAKVVPHSREISKWTLFHTLQMTHGRLIKGLPREVRCQ